MSISKCFRLYALPLLLSSALITLNCAAKEKSREQYQNDYNLMQNLLTQLENESIVQAEKQAKPKKVLDEDSRWIEDQIGQKQAATLKPELVTPKPKNKKKTRTRSR